MAAALPGSLWSPPDSILAPKEGWVTGNIVDLSGSLWSPPDSILALKEGWVTGDIVIVFCFSTAMGMSPGLHQHMGFPVKLTVQLAPGPQGEGLQGSGLSTHLWLVQTNPCLLSGSLTHSGLHPVIVSGFGISPGEQWQIAFPFPVIVHSAPGPQGLGLQGSGLSTHL